MKSATVFSNSHMPKNSVEGKILPIAFETVDTVFPTDDVIVPVIVPKSDPPSFDSIEEVFLWLATSMGAMISQSSRPKHQTGINR